MASVIFDPQAFRQRYPQQAGYSDEQLSTYFQLAAEFVNNGPRSRIPYKPPEVNTREILLYLLVCHFCQLDQRGGVVGNLSSAGEGSVNLSFSPPPLSNASAAWYGQTPCGYTAYMMFMRYALGGKIFRFREN
jgi:hypothetical protein